jgi:hypothetical protein
LLAHVIAEIRAEQTVRATRSLIVELADLKASLAELRIVLAVERNRTLDLPPLPRRELN